MFTLYSAWVPVFLLNLIFHKQILKSYREEHVVWVLTKTWPSWCSQGHPHGHDDGFLWVQWVNCVGTLGRSTQNPLKGGLADLALGVLSVDSLWFSVPSRSARAAESHLTWDYLHPSHEPTPSDWSWRWENGLAICPRGDNSENHSNSWIPCEVSGGHSQS